MPTTNPRAAVVGAGFIAGLHVDALRRLGIPVVALQGSDPERHARKAGQWGIGRYHLDVDALAADPEVDVVHVTSPNHAHFPQVMALLAAGKHVVCEKPLALTPEDGQAMTRLAAERDLVNAVCYNTRFYPLAHQARAMVAAGRIGTPRLITGAYQQDWLLLDTDWNWRLVPGEAGRLRAVADIGSHWLDHVQFVTGARVTEVLADLHTFVPVRRRPTGPVETFTAHTVGEASPRVDVPMDSDDAATILLRFEGGARGALTVSQVSPGRKNSLRYEVAGSTAGLAWDAEDPERLWVGHRDRPNEILLRDPSLLDPAAAAVAHYPGGHAEGFAETFLGLFEAVYAAVRGGAMPADRATFPTFADGLRGLRLDEAILASHTEGRWAPVKDEEEQ